MARRLLAIACLLLAGCAGVPVAPRVELPWQDAAFDWSPALVTVTREELFRLPPELAQQLQSNRLRELGSWRRLDALMAAVFGPRHDQFGYAAGHSRSAAETWRLRRGDCLSLTILTYAAARALGLDAEIQEVRVPLVYERHDGLDYLNRHVNLRVHVMNRSPVQEVLKGREIVVDFEPGYASSVRGQPVGEDGILARYYNNRGVEFLAEGKRSEAYAHLKAALLADARLAPAYDNLAVLYRQQGLLRESEQLLRTAVELGSEPELPLRALHAVLQEQGRDSEAREVGERLRRYEQSDPAYWIALGVRRLREGDARGAAAALERAQEMTQGFAEVHAYLALAYWGLGERALAGKQLDLLAAVDPGSAKAAKLRRKFDTSH